MRVTSFVIEFIHVSHLLSFIKLFSFIFRAQYLILVMSLISIAAVTLVGLIMYAHYADCDPYISQQIEKPDQVRRTRQKYVYVCLYV